MKYEEICSHIQANREVRIARFNVSVSTRGNIGLPVRVFDKLKSGRVRKYVEVRTRAGKTHNVDMCQLRNLEPVMGV